MATGDADAPAQVGLVLPPVPVHLIDAVTEVWLRAQRWKTAELAVTAIVAHFAINGVKMTLRDNAGKRIRFQCSRNARGKGSTRSAKTNCIRAITV
jgi:hypothetical protein